MTTWFVAACKLGAWKQVCTVLQHVNKKPNFHRALCTILDMNSNQATAMSGNETDQIHEFELNLQCRNNFLYFLSCCQGKEASLRMYEGSKNLACRVEAFQPQLKHIAVSNLATPIGMEKSAIIRTSDLVEVRFRKENNNTQ